MEQGALGDWTPGSLAESFGIERSDRLTGRTADDNGVGAVEPGREVDPERQLARANSGMR